MKQKKSLLYISIINYLVTLSAYALIANVQAQIPVTVTSSVPDAINHAETMLKWAEQYKQLESQYNQMRQQYQSTIGSRGLGNIFNDPNVQSALPADWHTVLRTIKSTPTYNAERAKFPIDKNNPKANALYDTLAANNATMTEFFGKTNARLSQVKKLMNQIDLAPDPAAKADLQARLISEQNAIQGTTQLLTVMQAKQQQEVDAASREARKEWLCKEFKKTGC